MNTIYSNIIILIQLYVKYQLYIEYLNTIIRKHKRFDD